MGIENGRINIMGPCAAESRSQVLQVAEALKQNGVGIERASWWKPRTQPGGFEGVGIAAAPWCAEVTQMGLTIATEVMSSEHVTDVMQGMRMNGGDMQKVLLWLGSRNQDHLTQRAVAKAMLDETPQVVMLMIKNQPWYDNNHWLGIVEHVLSTGFPEDRILLCHRGFAPGKNEPNPDGFRNIPDYDAAREVKRKTGLPMIIDPSHIGGKRENVLKALTLAPNWAFDGVMVEVHPDPNNARTDAKQQLNITDLDTILKLGST